MGKDEDETGKVSPDDDALSEAVVSADGGTVRRHRSLRSVRLYRRSGRGTLGRLRREVILPTDPELGTGAAGISGEGESGQSGGRYDNQ